MEVNKLRQMLEAQKKAAKQMAGMSEADMMKMQADVKAGKMPSGMGASQSYSKGKGKGRGQAKFLR